MWLLADTIVTEKSFPYCSATLSQSQDSANSFQSVFPVSQNKSQHNILVMLLYLFSCFIIFCDYPSFSLRMFVFYQCSETGLGDDGGPSLWHFSPKFLIPLEPFDRSMILSGSGFHLLASDFTPSQPLMLYKECFSFSPTHRDGLM